MFAEILREKMKARKWQPVHLAAAMATEGRPVAVVTVERWLDGESTPSYGALLVVASIFNMTMDELQPADTDKSGE